MRAHELKTAAEHSTFIAHEILPAPDMPLEPAPAARLWMDESRDRFAYRCLPLVIANQSGWVIACPRNFAVRWNGGCYPKDVRLFFGREKPDNRIMSHFGEGVVTFWIPYLFRTPPGINLWVKGPSNCVKDGVQALEAVVETDWSVSSFTMNWKLTRPRHTVRFAAGEPICMVVPVPRGLAESIEPRQKRLADNPQLSEQFHAWSRSRSQFLEALDNGDAAAVTRGWEKDYMKGKSPDGKTFDGHQTRVHLRPFARDDSSAT
jgi:hypothetical protein